MQRTTINTGAPTSRFQKISRSLPELLLYQLHIKPPVHIALIAVLYLCTCQAFPGPPRLLYAKNAPSNDRNKCPAYTNTCQAIPSPSVILYVCVLFEVLM
jgi:hypothetical protein